MDARIVPKKIKGIDGFGEKGQLVTWPLTLGDTGESHAGGADSIQVEGVFGEKGLVQVEGSNDGEGFHPLTDAQGNLLILKRAGIVTPGDRPRFFRPRVAAGDATTALTVTALVRR